MVALCRGAVFTGFAEVLAARGVEPKQLAAEAGLAPEALEDTDALVPVSIAGRFYGLSLERGGSDVLIEIAARRRLSNFGPLGLAIANAVTLGDVLRIIADFGELQNDRYRAIVWQDGETTLFSPRLVSLAPDVVLQIPPWAVEFLIVSAFRVVDQVSDGRIVPTGVTFAHGPSPHVDRLTQLLRTPPRFDQKIDSIAFSTADLDLPLPGRTSPFAQASLSFLRVAAARHTAWQRTSSLAFKVACDLIPKGACSKASLAKALGMSTRTLHRRLAGNDTSYEDIVDQVRSRLLETYLAQRHMTFAQIARKLGFLSQPAFTRWVKGRFGRTPGDLRARTLS